VTHAVLVHAEDAADQLQEVMSVLDIQKAGSDLNQKMGLPVTRDRRIINRRRNTTDMI
jgi:hypothetical protein